MNNTQPPATEDVKKPIASLESSAFLAGLAFVLMSAGAMLPGDWASPLTLLPVSAPETVLEAGASGTAEGTMVSIRNPTGKANQKWIIAPKGNDLYAITPACSSRWCGDKIWKRP